MNHKSKSFWIETLLFLLLGTVCTILEEGCPNFLCHSSRDSEPLQIKEWYYWTKTFLVLPITLVEKPLFKSNTIVLIISTRVVTHNLAFSLAISALKLNS